MPRRVVAALAAGTAVVAAVVATISWGVAAARNESVTVRAVTDAQMPSIRAAAGSCPMLSPARIAGQLMAESGLDNRTRTTVSGGQHIAGLDDDAWKTWKPWPAAQRSDSAANILALAHQMCDLSGQLRLAQVPGDRWRLSLAAFHKGLPTVTQAKGIPASAVDYVDLVSANTARYEDLTPFSGEGGPKPATPPDGAKGVPDQYIPLIIQAGSICQQVPPPAVAAQLMALSAFDTNKLGPAGQRGIAQFLPDVWQTYGTETSSPWDPAAAIPILGATMCTMITELSPLDGDPYPLALAAYRNGPTTIRQNGTTYDQPTQTFLTTVKELTDFYTLDTRLRTPTPTTPTQVKPTQDKPPSPSQAAKPTQDADPQPLQTPTPAAPPARVGHIVGPADAGKCVDVDTNTGDNGRAVQLWDCNDVTGQRWSIGADGTIRAFGKCLDIVGNASANRSQLHLWQCNGTGGQQWRPQPSGSLLNPQSGRCLDSPAGVTANGTRLQIYDCNGRKPQVWNLPA